MKRTIVISLLLISAAALLAGMGTFAYFSDTASSTGNTFTSGTIDMVLSDSDEAFSQGVTATWSSPANWAPGQEVDATINMKNMGSIAAKKVFADWNNLTDPDGLASKIQVTWWSDSTYSSYNSVPDFLVYDQNGDGQLSLYELVNGDAFYPGSVPVYEATFWCTEGGDPADPNPDHNCLNPGGANSWWNPAEPFSIRMKFKFMEDAGNAYQGKTASFDLSLVASQV